MRGPSLRRHPADETAIEREAATAVARKQLTAMGVTLAILLAVASLPLAIPNGYRVPDIGPWAAVILSVVAVFGYFGSIAVLILRARDLWRTRARFLADIAAGTVMEFAGPVPAAAPADERSTRAYQAGHARSRWVGECSASPCSP